MAAAPPTAPVKPFRDEAKTEPVQCPACGGPITLKGFGAIEQVACPYCGSELAPEDSGALSILQQVQRQRRQSMMPLQARGTIDGIEWEVLGIVWRECRVDGVTYPWQEFLLFNPYRGYRWLVYQMSDHHWQLGATLEGAPRADSGGFSHKSVEFKKQRFKHFQTVVGRVTYVEGEFPWQVHVGDHAVAHEYIAPPQGISVEESSTPDGGSDVVFTGMRHIDAKEVWKAFRLPGSPPRRSGVGSLRPNPHRKQTLFYWLSFAALLVAWIGISLLYAGGRSNKVVFESADISQGITQEIEIGTRGHTTTLEIDMSSGGLSNSWAYAEVMLISQEKEEATGAGLTAEEWHGVDGGESWREGDQSPSVTLGGVEGGKYLLQITMQSGDASGGALPAPPKASIKLTEDVVLTRYMILPFFVLIAFPLINLFRSAFFEGRRWNNSDYAASE
jgi:DNA-directed RNA polymerase subunit RPC12/RpoP